MMVELVICNKSITVKYLNTTQGGALSESVELVNTYILSLGPFQRKWNSDLVSWSEVIFQSFTIYVEVWFV